MIRIIWVSITDVILPDDWNFRKSNIFTNYFTSVIRFFDDTCEVGGENITFSEISIIRKYDISDRNPNNSDHDYVDAPNIQNLTDFKEAAISYVAGYVLKMVKQKISCADCIESLGSKKYSVFLSQKRRGGLIKPFFSVERIC